MNFKKHILLIFLVLLVILTFSSSYYRFVVTGDYLVSYEGTCDPEISTCYVGCEDDECTTEYYFTVIQREHNSIYNLCGENILECEAANFCQEAETNCSVSFCDMETEADACETVNEDIL